MTMKYTKHMNVKATPQSEAIPGEAQIKNAAGGYVYSVGEWAQFNRFLILGTEGGSYYVGEKAMTKENAENVIKCIKEDGVKAVNTIVAVSDAGRAIKNDPAIFALALACTFGDEVTKKLAYSNITKVCRIGTHIFTFCQYIQDLRSWSRGLRNGVSKFYVARKPEKLELQLVKYRQRNGWTHTDVIRLAHPSSTNTDTNALLRYAVGKATEYKSGSLIEAFEAIQKSKDVKEVCELIRKHDLPREAVQTEMLNDVKVWEALLENMPMTAMIRNLGKMTSVGLLKSNLDEATKKVVEQLGDAEAIKTARVHPIAILLALKNYGAGHGFKGHLLWKPVSKIVDALDEAFYTAFANVEPTGKNWLLGIDVSSSMESQINGTNLSNAEAVAAVALITARTEKNYEIMAFADRFKSLEISPRMRMDDVLKKTTNANFGGTDCSLPMVYAANKKLDVDAFTVYTDNETWAGNQHPVQALRAYRKAFNKPEAKLIVMATSATEGSIADPKDPNMLDVCGFDASAPQAIAEFVKGL